MKRVQLNSSHSQSVIPHTFIIVLKTCGSITDFSSSCSTHIQSGFISAALLRWQKKYQNKSFSLYSFLWFNHLYGLAAAVGNRHTTRQGLSSLSSQSFLFSDPKSIMDAESSHCSSGKLSLTSQYSRCYICSCLICQLLINLQLIIARFYLQ